MKKKENDIKKREKKVKSSEKETVAHKEMRETRERKTKNGNTRRQPLS